VTTAASEVIQGGDLTNQAVYVASSSGGSYAGTAAAELIIGGSGDDTLTGAGADTLMGGNGDDVFVVSDGASMLIDGGGGLDQVIVDTSLSVDLSLWQDLDQVTLQGDSSFSINSDMLNQLVNGSNEAALALGATASAANNIFIITGEATDIVTVDLSGSLTLVDMAGDLGSNVDSYTVYQDTTTSAMLYVDNTVAISGSGELT
jgi:Ca2+-binding RTX toxin-like protein